MKSHTPLTHSRVMGLGEISPGWTHKSKGLQYPLVFVPYAGSFTVEKTTAATALPDEDTTDPADDTSSSTDEDMRLLYVALTRGQRAVWLGVAEAKIIPVTNIVTK